MYIAGITFSMNSMLTLGGLRYAPQEHFEKHDLKLNLKVLYFKVNFYNVYTFKTQI